MTDVSFGQYYPAKSFVHRLDSRLKFIWLIGYIAAVFSAKDFYALGACAIVFFLVAAFSGVPIGKLLKSVQAVAFLLLFTSLLNLFFGQGETVLWQWEFIVINQRALQRRGT